MKKNDEQLHCIASIRHTGLQKDGLFPSIYGWSIIAGWFGREKPYIKNLLSLTIEPITALITLFPPSCSHVFSRCVSRGTSLLGVTTAAHNVVVFDWVSSGAQFFLFNCTLQWILKRIKAVWTDLVSGGGACVYAVQSGRLQLPRLCDSKRRIGGHRPPYTLYHFL